LLFNVALSGSWGIGRAECAQRNTAVERDLTIPSKKVG